MARKRKAPKAKQVTPHSVPANPSKWSVESQRTLSAEFIKRYTDITYQCRRCKQSAVFSADDQRYTYEVSKAPIDQRRILCARCWRRLLEIDRDIKQCNDQWQASKAGLRTDGAFLESWLKLLTSRDEFAPRRRNTAAKNMLRKLLDRQP